MFRFKAKQDSNRTPIVVIELDDDELRNKLPFAAKNLKMLDNFKNVYLNADMTVCERARYNDLRRERDEKNKKETGNAHRWTIRNDTTVRFKVAKTD